MRIAAVQLKPVKGDVAANIDRHVVFIRAAVAEGSSLIMFPELSLTGYEPALAAELATDVTDGRLEVFQQLSDQGRATLAVGLPIRQAAGITITMLLFQPGRPKTVYSKQYLHPDEDAYFVRGVSVPVVTLEGTAVAPSICYELSVPGHPRTAFENHATVYAASVAKHAAGVQEAKQRLSAIAHTYTMIAVMSNCVGACDNFVSAGGTGAWDRNGRLMAELDDRCEGLVVADTDRQSAVAIVI